MAMTERERRQAARHRVMRASDRASDALTPGVARLLSLQRVAGNTAVTDVIMRANRDAGGGVETGEAVPSTDVRASRTDGALAPTLAHESDRHFARELGHVAQQRRSDDEANPAQRSAGRVAARSPVLRKADDTSTAADSAKVGVGTAPDGAIPHTLHIAWTGGSAASARADMATLAAKFPEWDFVLWMEMPHTPMEPAQVAAGPGPLADVQGMIEWAAGARIRVADVNEVSANAAGTGQNTMDRLAPATDRLRADILNRFGGVYSDADTLSEGALPATLQRIAGGSNGGLSAERR
jgi:hypothetical protein